jgi:hypothetical protein
LPWRGITVLSLCFRSTSWRNRLVLAVGLENVERVEPRLSAVEHKIGELAPPVLVQAHDLAVEDGGLRAEFLRERPGERQERFQGVSIL